MVQKNNKKHMLNLPPTPDMILDSAKYFNHINSNYYMVKK